MSDGIVDAAKDVARDANDHPVVEAAARLGYAASGLVHVLIAWAALGIAWTPLRRGAADQSGALGGLAKEPWGAPLLWVLVAGFVGLAAWQLTEAIVGRHGRGASKAFGRAKAIGKMAVYLALGWTAFTFAQGGVTDSRAQSTEATASLLAGPMGRLVVGGLGVAVVGIGAYHVLKGLRKTFLQDLTADPGEFAEQVGRLGYVAKGVALAVVGGLLVAAAFTADARHATGLDGALRTLADTAYGTALLTVVAIGIGAYGVYSFFRARHTRV